MQVYTCIPSLKACLQLLYDSVITAKLSKAKGEILEVLILLRPINARIFLYFAS